MQSTNLRFFFVEVLLGDLGLDGMGKVVGGAAMSVAADVGQRHWRWDVRSDTKRQEDGALWGGLSV